MLDLGDKQGTSENWTNKLIIKIKKPKKYLI